MVTMVQRQLTVEVEAAFALADFGYPGLTQNREGQSHVPLHLMSSSLAFIIP